MPASPASALRAGVLLALACNGLLGATGCSLGRCAALTNEAIDTGSATAIVAISGALAVDARGRVLPFASSRTGEWMTLEHPVRDALSVPDRFEGGLVVGDAGFVAGASPGDMATWSSWPTPTSADLARIVPLELASGPRLALLGPEVLLVSGEEGLREVAPPPGGWHELRDLVIVEELIWAVGAATLWTSALPRPSGSASWSAPIWTVHDLAPKGPLLGAVSVPPPTTADPTLLFVFDATTLYRVRPSGLIAALELSLEGQIIAAGGGVVTTSAGEVITLGEEELVIERHDLGVPLSASFGRYGHPFPLSALGTTDGRIIVQKSQRCYR